MAGGDAEQGERRPFRRPAVLLPVAKRVHADPERAGELDLRQGDEPAHGGNVARSKVPFHDELALAVTQGAGEVCWVQIPSGA